MAVEFRCDKCGRVLTTDAAAGMKARCSGCGAKVPVPGALARLPQPIAAGAATAPAAAEGDIAPSHPVSEGMARMMPLAVSLFLHVGMAVLLSFVFMFIAKKAPAGFVVAGTVPSGELSMPLEDPTTPPEWTEERAVEVSQGSPGGRREDNRLVSRQPNESTAERLFGVGAAKAGAGLDVGMGPGGEGDDPTIGFGRRRIPNAGHHVVYVIDRSGSMQETFDTVRDDLLGDIGELSPRQDFHVIFFAEGRQHPVENRPRRLVPATDRNKDELAGFAEGIIVAGNTTDPIPAMRRAFAVLANADQTRKGKVICLLTDGEFANSKAVLAALRAMNRNRDVVIHTILHEHKNPEAEKVLRAIADEHGGTYRFAQVYEQ